MPFSKKNIIKTIFGFTLTFAGFTIVVVEMQVAILERRAAHFLNIGVGFTLAFIGSYTIVPTMAEKIASVIIDTIKPLLPYNTTTGRYEYGETIVPGGRRKTDPPLIIPNVVPARPMLMENEEDEDDGIL